MTSIRVSRRPPAAFAPRRTTPARSTEELTDRIRSFFQAPFEQHLWPSVFGELMAQPLGMRPPMEVVETPEEYSVTAELPGMDRKDIKVEFEDGRLMIRGEKEETREEKADERRYLLWERTYGSFERSFSMDGVDTEHIGAEYKDGVLTVHLPKTPTAKVKGRKIPIA
jgi:HSP20 family protein